MHFVCRHRWHCRSRRYGEILWRHWSWTRKCKFKRHLICYDVNKPVLDLLFLNLALKNSWEFLKRNEIQGRFICTFGNTFILNPEPSSYKNSSSLLPPLIFHFPTTLKILCNNYKVIFSLHFLQEKWISNIVSGISTLIMPFQNANKGYI